MALLGASRIRSDIIGLFLLQRWRYIDMWSLMTFYISFSSDCCFIHKLNDMIGLNSAKSDGTPMISDTVVEADAGKLLFWMMDFLVKNIAPLPLMCCIYLERSQSAHLHHHAVERCQMAISSITHVTWAAWRGFMLHVVIHVWVTSSCPPPPSQVCTFNNSTVQGRGRRRVFSLST